MRARPWMPVLASAVAVLCTGTAASAAAPIRPGQHFVGIVNGVRPGNAAVVRTVCAGPISPGRTGPVAGGQTLAVARVHAGGGYTGPFSQVYAWFAEDASDGGPQQAKLASYGTPVGVPAGVRVPCDGTGEVVFSPCPHLAPCAAGWAPTSVKVQYQNIAL